MAGVMWAAGAWRAGFVAISVCLLAGCDRQEEAGTTTPTPIANPAPPAQTGAGTEPVEGRSGTVGIPVGNGFDFYVLSLSWSPSYCEAEGPDADRQQCRSGRRYAFVVHGLWPQFERGFPQDCDTDEKQVDDVASRSLYDLMPSAGLIGHEWREHGACSRLSQTDYFQVLRMAREKIVIPSEFRSLSQYRTLAPKDVEQSFLKANSGLKPGQVAVTCDKRYLRDVRICLTKRLGFRDCPKIDRRACRMDKVVMPPLRAG